MNKTKLTYNIFEPIVYLYLSSKEFDKQTNSEKIREFSDYCLIDQIWFENFKKIYKYDEIEDILEKNPLITNLTGKQLISIIEFLYYGPLKIKNNKSFVNIYIDEQEENELKENFKPINSEENSFPRNFLLLKENVYSSLINALFPNDKYKTITEDILIGINSLILLLKKDKNSIICIFLNMYDDSKHEFKITYTSEKLKNSGIEFIKNYGLEKYFIENGVDKNEIDEKKINNTFSVININRETIKSKRANRSLQLSFLLNSNSNNSINSDNQEEKLNDKFSLYKSQIGGKEKFPILMKNEASKIGLVNLGNTCYINAGLQCLCSITVQIRFFSYNINKENLKKYPYKYPLSNVFCDVINNLYPEDTELPVQKYEPKNFCKTLFILNEKFKEGEQNDAKEFVLYVITKLNDELKNDSEKENGTQIFSKNKKDNSILNYNDCYKYCHSSIISDTFYWVKQILKKCKNCSYSEENYLPKFFMKFDLETIRREKYFQKNENEIQKIIPNRNLSEDEIEKINEKILIEYEKKQNTPVSLKECLDFYLKEKETKDICPNCGNNLFLKKNIYASPNVFIIILARGKNNMHNVKLEFTEKLNITEYVVLDSCEHKYNDYNLIGVITHTGMSGGKDGHFIAFTLSPNNLKWYKYDDDIVTEPERTEVFNTGYPYVLFYKTNKKIDDI